MSPQSSLYPYTTLFRSRDPFALGVWVNLYGLKSSEVLQKKDSSEHWAGYELGFDDVAYTGRHQRHLRVVARFAERWPDSAIEVRSEEHTSELQSPYDLV